VDVEVEDRLPRRCAARVDEVDAVCAERLLGARGEPLGGRGNRGEVLLADLEQVGRVLARDDERVRSSSPTTVAGSSPATILQNRQSGSGPGMSAETNEDWPRGRSTPPRT
jgi:hypothetical protein